MNRPNVVLFFSDQHRASVLGKQNHPDVQTPHLDALAAGDTMNSAVKTVGADADKAGESIKKNINTATE